MIRKKIGTWGVFLILLLIISISESVPCIAFAAGVDLPAGGVVADKVDLPAGGVVAKDIPGAIGGLSTARNFHIFSNEAEVRVHTNGNIATGNLIGIVDFGTKVRSGGVSKDIHYLKSVTQIASSSFVASTPTRGLKVVFGSGVNLSLDDSENFLKVNGTKLDHVTIKPPESNEAFIDKNKQTYIDFSTVFKELRAESDAFANNTQTTGVVINFDDRNNRVIDVSDANVLVTGAVKLTKRNENGTQTLSGATFDLYKTGAQNPIKTGLETNENGEITVTGLAAGDYFFRETLAPAGYEAIQQDTSFQIESANTSSSGYIYVTLKKAQLEQDTPITITGLSENRPGVIVNVDMQGSSSLDIQSQINLWIDGVERVNKETEDFSDAKLLWNFWNFSNSTDDKNIYVNKPFQGTILATGAYVEANQNVDGSIIANRVNINGGESHRWDFQMQADTSAEPVEVEVRNRLKPYGVTFSKVAAGQGTELAGADLTVKKADGTVVATWTSEGTAKVLKLTAGEYTMIESKAPLGYDVAETITFRVNPDGSIEIKQGETWVAAADAKIQMVDELKPTPTPPPTTPSYKPISVPLSAKKILQNGVLKEGQFAFELLGGDKKVIETVTNDASGIVRFTDRRFSKTGTFIYTIREVKGNDARITYDGTVYRVIIKTTAVNGELSAKVDYVKDGTPYAGDVKFVNRIDVPKTGDHYLQLPLQLAILSLLLFGGAMIMKKKQYRSVP